MKNASLFEGAGVVSLDVNVLKGIIGGVSPNIAIDRSQSEFDQESRETLSRDVPAFSYVPPLISMKSIPPCSAIHLTLSKASASCQMLTRSVFERDG